MPDPIPLHLNHLAAHLTSAKVSFSNLQYTLTIHHLHSLASATTRLAAQITALKNKNSHTVTPL